MISKNLYNLALLFQISNGPIFHISNGPILKYTSDQTADSPPPQTSLEKRFNPPSSQKLASLLADKK